MTTIDPVDTHSFISPDVTQLSSPASDQWGDNFDIKLQYLVESAKKNFHSDVDEETEEEFEFGTSSPSSLDSFNSILDEDLNSTGPRFSLEGGLPTPDIMEEDGKTLDSQPNKPLGFSSRQKHSEQFYNPVLTPIEPMSYDWDHIKYKGNDLSTFSRVLRRTQDFQLSPASEHPDAPNAENQNQFLSQEIYPQIITTDIPSTPNSNPTSSIIRSAIDSPETTTTLQKKTRVRQRRTRIPKFSYDLNAKPVAQQLIENTKIWNKISQKKKKGIYKCTHCPEIFKDLYDLAKHIDSNKISRQHKCPFDDCPWSIIGLPRRAEVRRHCAAQHACVITYPGDNKDKNTPTETETTETTSPETTVNGELFNLRIRESLTCQYDFCGKHFKRKDSQQRHEKLVHLNPNSRFNRRIQKMKEHYKTNDVQVLTAIIERRKKAMKQEDDHDE